MLMQSLCAPGDISAKVTHNYDVNHLSEEKICTKVEVSARRWLVLETTQPIPMLPRVSWGPSLVGKQMALMSNMS